MGDMATSTVAEMGDMAMPVGDMATSTVAEMGDMATPILQIKSQGAIYQSESI